MAPFKIGDVVRLKSGGPAMTVGGGDGRAVHCEWFDGKKLVRATFFAEAVEAVQPAATGSRPAGP